MIQTMETADRDSRELQAQTTTPVPVNTVSRTQATALKPCFRCGEQHSPATCRFKDFVCNFCKKQAILLGLVAANNEQGITSSREEVEGIHIMLQQRTKRTVIHCLTLMA